MTITLFAAPKPFAGHIGVIQRNAVRSWTMLPGTPEVILFGDEPGIADTCAELGLLHVPDIATNEYGTPLVSDMFDRAQTVARTDTVCFINADIILTSRSAEAVDRVHDWSGSFMIVGRRYEVDIVDPLPFDDPDWERQLLRVAGPTPRSTGDLAIDWFAFPRGRLTGLPPFAIGRTVYDNWLLWRAPEVGLPLVDATAFAPVYHQRHDYAHGGSKLKVWEGPEAVRQRAMIGHWTNLHTIAHARWMLDPGGRVVPARGWRYRMARPRRVLSQALRFTRPIRWRLEREPKPRVRQP